MKTFLLCLLFTLIALATIVPSTHAGLYFYIDSGPSGVTITASGSLDITGLTPLSTLYGEDPDVDSSQGKLGVGSVSPVESFDGITDPATGYTFGNGSDYDPQSSTGAQFGLYAFANSFFVPSGYQSGTPISGGSETFRNVPLSTLGITPGTYIYGINSGVNADTITVSTVAPAPEPGTWALLGIGAAGLGLTLRRRPARV